MNNRSRAHGGGPRRLVIMASALAGLTGPPAADAQQAPARISGRVVAEDTGRPIGGATVTLVHREVPDSIVHTSVTNDLGLFQVLRTRSGEYQVTVEHLAYGAFEDRVVLERGQSLALRVTLSTRALVIDPVVVEAVRAQTRDGRSRGTSRRVVTWEELLPIAETGAHLGVAMSQLLPGVRLTSQRSTPGELICLQFRNPVTLQDRGCLPPLVMVDGVRQANSVITLNTLPLNDIRRIEVLPPGEAGVQYGTDSQYGVVLIETFTGNRFGPTVAGAGAGIYSWSLESEPYPWARSLVLAGAANAVGLLAAYGIAQSCLSFDGLTNHFYQAECGFLGNTASRAALYVAPQLAVGYLVQRLGYTDLSSGNMWKSAIASTILSVPGVILTMTSEEDGFGGSQGIGAVLLGLGAPIAAVAADRLFRRVHP